MSIRATTPGTTFESAKGWYQGRVCSVYRQKVTLTSGAHYQGLGFSLPAKSAVIYYHCRNGTSGVTITGGVQSAAVDGIAIAAFPVSAATQTTALTAPPANTASVNVGTGTNGWLIGRVPGTGTTESNGIGRGRPLIEGYSTVGKAVNTYAAAAYLALVPTVITASSFQIRATGTDSNLLNNFGTQTVDGTSTTDCGYVDVVMYVETLDDYPSF